ncbi:MAG: MlaD family protein [Opitutaceae bacterium]|nr:MlaD family protein [Opitutaceae bacterium]
MNNLQQTARVGLFFLLGLALIWVTFETLNGGKILKDEGYAITAGFESLKELKQGDEVRMAGVRIGEVQSTRLAGRRAEAILRIDPMVTIKSDATASIVTAGLIGTNYIGIDLGTAGVPDLVPREKTRSPRGFFSRILPFLQPEPEPIAEIQTKTAADLNSIMAQIGALGEKLESSLGSLGTAFAGDGKNPGLIQKIDGLVTDNREKLTATMTNIREITDKVNKGEGTLGRLISDPKLHDELVATLNEIKAGATEAKGFIANAQSIIDHVKQGKGAIGTLVFDEKIGDDIRSSVATLRTISDKISRGEGTLGKLLNDDSLFRDTQAIMKKADRALDGFDDTGPITAVGVVYRGLF